MQTNGRTLHFTIVELCYIINEQIIHPVVILSKYISKEYMSTGPVIAYFLLMAGYVLYYRADRSIIPTLIFRSAEISNTDARATFYFFHNLKIHNTLTITFVPLYGVPKTLKLNFSNYILSKVIMQRNSWPSFVYVYIGSSYLNNKK